jgi:rod shape-determining protein MreC
MRSFFLFLIKNHVFFLFLLLELTALWFVFSNNAFQKTAFVHSANNLTGNVLNTYGNMTRYFFLREVNDSLMAENAMLRQQILSESLIDSSGEISVRDSSGILVYTCLPAQVINNTYTMPNNYVTINKGSEDGIERDMGVITSSGIVGIVKEVSAHYAVVLSVLHGSFHTRVAIRKNNEQGRLVWKFGDPTMVQVVDVSEPGTLHPGDTIVTTGYSAAFPPNYIVGELVDYGKETGSNFYTLNVRLSTEFSRLRFVYVVNYLYKNEVKDLENAANASQ